MQCGGGGLVPKSVFNSCDSMDCSLPDSSIQPGISQARILEWVAISFPRGSSHPRDWTLFSSHCRWFLYQLSHHAPILQYASCVLSGYRSEPCRASWPVCCGQENKTTAEKTGDHCPTQGDREFPIVLVLSIEWGLCFPLWSPCENLSLIWLLKWGLFAGACAIATLYIVHHHMGFYKHHPQSIAYAALLYTECWQ